MFARSSIPTRSSPYHRSLAAEGSRYRGSRDRKIGGALVAATQLPPRPRLWYADAMPLQIAMSIADGQERQPRNRATATHWPHVRARPNQPINDRALTQLVSSKSSRITPRIADETLRWDQVADPLYTIPLRQRRLQPAGNGQRATGGLALSLGCLAVQHAACRTTSSVATSGLATGTPERPLQGYWRAAVGSEIRGQEGSLARRSSPLRQTRCGALRSVHSYRPAASGMHVHSVANAVSRRTELLSY